MTDRSEVEPLAVANLRQEYFDTLMEQARESPLPTAGLLDRIEHAIEDREQAEEYVGLLLSIVQRMPPFLQLLDRIDGMIRRLEVVEARRRQAEQPDSSPHPEPSMDMKKAELLALADERGVDVPAKATKKEIVDLLSA